MKSFFVWFVVAVVVAVSGNLNIYYISIYSINFKLKSIEFVCYLFWNKNHRFLSPKTAISSKRFIK